MYDKSIGKIETNFIDILKECTDNVQDSRLNLKDIIDAVLLLIYNKEAYNNNNNLTNNNYIEKSDFQNEEEEQKVKMSTPTHSTQSQKNKAKISFEFVPRENN